MNRTLAKLIWKEWHEHRWKLGFGCVILTAFAAIGLRARLVPDEAMLMAVALIGVTLLPVLSSMGLIAPERSDGSLHTLLALPVPTRQVLFAKTLMGVVLCVGPMLTALIASLIVAGGREMAITDILNLYAWGMIAIVFVFMWMLALSARLPSEARAGLIGLAVLVGCWIIFVGFASGAAPTWLWTLCPWVFLFATLRFPGSEAASLPAAVPGQLLIAVGLWLWTVRQLRSEKGAAA